MERMNSASSRRSPVVAITGAAGFLGRYVAVEALRRGYSVLTLVRPMTDETRLPWYGHPSAKIVHLDLREPTSIATTLQGVDAVIHLAAAKEGGYEVQYASTVQATENLLQAMVTAKVSRLIAISTFSVFDYQAIRVGETVTEDSPIERFPTTRDIYAQTKLIQESLVRQFEQTHGGQVTIIRPGMVYGRNYLWNASLGARKGDRFWLRIGTDAQIPLTYIENCAAAIVNAVQCPEAIGNTLNIVDDNLPTQTDYANQLLARMSPRPTVVTVHWGMMNWLAQTIWQINQGIFRGKLKVPGIFVPARLHARFKPLHYSNARAKQILHWQPQYSLEAALDRSFSQTNLLALPPQTTPTPLP